MVNESRMNWPRGSRRTRRPPIWFYVPSNFEARAVLPPELHRYADCANYLVNLVVLGQAQWKGGQSGFVRLKVAYLRNYIPDRYERAIRTALIDHGVLECDWNYERGVTSRGYRLGTGYGADFARVACEDTRLADRLRAQDRPVRPRVDVHRNLLRWLGELRIDVPLGRAAASLLDHPGLQRVAIDLIHHRRFQFSVCNMGRVHTNLTRLARELRPALRVGGAPLCNVDVVNSQPMILALVIDVYRRCGGDIRARCNIGKDNPYTDLSSLRNPSTSTFTSNTMSKRKGNQAEVEAEPRIKAEGELLRSDEADFIRLCEEGQIYDHLQARAGLMNLSRDDLKEKFFREVFFGRNRVVTDFTRLFAGEFPGVMEVIRDVKREDHSDLACVMQNLESSLMIDRVCRRLMDDHPDVPVLTIHDSVMSTPAHVDLVRSVMAEEFAQVGLRPRFKLEGFGGSDRFSMN